MEVFQDYAYYYNLFYGDKDYKSEAEIVDKILKKYGNSIKTVINFGCGTGRHDIELSKSGYSMTGIDFSKTMIEVAKSNLQKENKDSIKYEVGDVRTFKTKGKYNAVISLFHVMSYQNSNEDIEKAFTTAFGSLDEDGIFLFDVWYGPGVLTERPETRIKEVEDQENKIIRFASPIIYANTNIVDVNYKVLITNNKTNITSCIEETHSMRYFFAPEIEILLKKVGFELIGFFDCNSLESPTFDSWTVYCIAKKVQ